MMKNNVWAVLEVFSGRIGDKSLKMMKPPTIK